MMFVAPTRKGAVVRAAGRRTASRELHQLAACGADPTGARRRPTSFPHAEGEYDGYGHDLELLQRRHRHRRWPPTSPQIVHADGHDEVDELYDRDYDAVRAGRAARTLVAEDAPGIASSARDTRPSRAISRPARQPAGATTTVRMLAQTIEAAARSGRRRSRWPGPPASTMDSRRRQAWTPSARRAWRRARTAPPGERQPDCEHEQRVATGKRCCCWRSALAAKPSDGVGEHMPDALGQLDDHRRRGDLPRRLQRRCRRGALFSDAPSARHALLRGPPQIALNRIPPIADAVQMDEINWVSRWPSAWVRSSYDGGTTPRS